jgi:flagellar protein FlaG
MNIPSLGPITSLKPDDRTVKTAAPQADTASGPAPSREQVDDAVKKLNESMSASSPSLEFSVDDDSKRIIVKLIDQSTKEVLRQIPSVEALQMAKAIDKMQGRMIHHTA